MPKTMPKIGFLDQSMINFYKQSGLDLPTQLKKIVLTRKVETPKVQPVKPKATVQKVKASAISAKLDENARAVMLEAVELRARKLEAGGLSRGESQVQALHDEGLSHLYAQSDTHETLAETVAKIPTRPEPTPDFRNPATPKEVVDTMVAEVISRIESGKDHI